MTIEKPIPKTVFLWGKKAANYILVLEITALI